LHKGSSQKHGMSVPLSAEIKFRCAHGKQGAGKGGRGTNGGGEGRQQGTGYKEAMRIWGGDKRGDGGEKGGAY
jgi:hypothetical protein